MQNYFNGFHDLSLFPGKLCEQLEVIQALNFLCDYCFFYNFSVLIVFKHLIDILSGFYFFFSCPTLPINTGSNVWLYNLCCHSEFCNHSGNAYSKQLGWSSTKIHTSGQWVLIWKIWKHSQPPAMNYILLVSHSHEAESTLYF